jgi:hypothetical protein
MPNGKKSASRDPYSSAGHGFSVSLVTTAAPTTTGTQDTVTADTERPDTERPDTGRAGAVRERVLREGFNAGRDTRTGLGAFGGGL